MTDAYLRYPDVHGDRVIFVADDDVWCVSTSGGLARRVTTGGAAVRNPKFSPEGSLVAYVSKEAGGDDVYLVDADGTSRRLTWWSDPRARVTGWADENHIIVTATHEGAERGMMRAYLVSVDGAVERIECGIAGAVACSRDGARALTTPNGRDSAAWKRYRGGMAAYLWLDTGDGRWFRPLPEEAAGCYSPGFADGRLFFSADIGDGPRVQAQVWSVDAVGDGLRRHTDHTADVGYVRDPSSGDGRQVVYHCRGEIYYLADLDSEPVRLDVTTGLGEPAPVAIKPTDNLGSVVPDHAANGSLVEWRGAAFFLTHRAGPARALSDLPGVRIREPEVLGCTGQGIWASDAEGEDCLEIAALDGSGDPRRIAGGELGRVLHVRSNPKGDVVAVVSHDGRVSLVDVETGEVREIGRSAEGEALGLTFSPDGRYLVWRCAVGSEGEVGKLMCADVARAKTRELTRGQFNDFSPAFTADGKYLVFLSSRTLDPVYDELTFDLTHTRTIRPWLIPLRADEPAPFGASANGWAIKDLTDDAEDTAKKPTPVSVEIDFDGFEDRIVAFPVPSSRYADLAVAKDGVVWRTLAESGGELGTTRAGVDGDGPKDTVEHFSFVTRKATTVVEGCESFAISGDGERLVVRDGDSLWVQPSDAKPGEDDQTKVAVDLTRLRREVRPRDEWRQMFDENGRIMATHFWRADMDGVDWAGVVASYRPLVERLRTHDDLVDVLWETVGELNTSHAYVLPKVQPGDNGRAVGRLGVECVSDDSGARITRVLPGESSDPSAQSPLRAAGVGAREGDVIAAVDGRPVADAGSLGELLQGAVGKVVELTLSRDGIERRVAVVPTSSEIPLRYHEWVARNAEYVATQSGGRLGYVHIPDMGAPGWAEFHRQIEKASHAEGVVVDVRFNGGGHTSQLLIERLSRTVLGWAWGQHMDTPMTYPNQAMRGPIAFVTNAYAGSDGDIVCAAAQTASLGPVIGSRSWGGVIGIDGRFDLVDGTGITQPRYQSYFNKQGFGLENHGVDPDIVVDFSPTDWDSDDDIQLDRAVAEVLGALEKTPAAVAPAFEAPRFG